MSDGTHRVTRKALDPQTAVDVGSATMDVLQATDNNPQALVDALRPTVDPVAQAAVAAASDISGAAAHVQSTMEPMTPAHADLAAIKRSESE